MAGVVLSRLVTRVCSGSCSIDYATPFAVSLGFVASSCLRRPMVGIVAVALIIAVRVGRTCARWVLAPPCRYRSCV